MLLVAHESLYRVHLAACIGHAGFDVIAYATNNEALQWAARARESTVGVLVANVDASGVAGDINGLELGEELLQRYPHMERVYFCPQRSGLIVLYTTLIHNEGWTHASRGADESRILDALEFYAIKGAFRK